jgi:hypothetical protein
MKTYYDIEVKTMGGVFRLKGVSYSLITQLAVQGDTNNGPIVNIEILKEYSKKISKF